MPQMAPMWWTLLMIMFIISFIMSMTMLYFNFSMTSINKKIITLNKMNWKW